jgi:hypothetical protein
MDEEEVAYGDERGRAFELLRAMAGDQPTSWPVFERGSDSVRLLGNLPGGQIAFSDRSGLTLIDQHAASALLASLAPSSEESLEHAALLPAELQEAVHARGLALSELGFIVDGERLTAAPRWANSPLEALEELLYALDEGGLGEVKERAAIARALSPTVEPTAEQAMALYQGLVELERDAVVDSLAETRFRGRRVWLRLGRAEIARRLDE